MDLELAIRRLHYNAKLLSEFYRHCDKSLRSEHECFLRAQDRFEFRLKDEKISIENDNHLSSIEWFSWLGRWASDGMPTIRLFDPKWAASAAGTSVPPEYFRDIEPPFGAFLILIPPQSGLVFPDSSNILMVAVKYTSSWFYWRIIEENMKDGIGFMSPDHKMCESLPEIPSFSQTEHRAMDALRGLIVSISLWCKTSQPRKTSRKALASRTYFNGIAKDINEYVVGNPVQWDIRDNVRNYCLTGKANGPLTVQFMVRGHWKRQPCGPGRSDRKFIHVEPYWKGKGQGPILVRTHDIK